MYDRFNQLICENNFPDDTMTEFFYDGIGNITSKTTYDYTTLDLIKDVTYRYGKDGKSGWNNLLTGVDLNGNGSYSSSETISYDAIGNPTSYLGNSLTWFGRQLTGYSNSNQNIGYTYDADGYRASKTVNGQTTTYRYVNGMLVYECRPDMEIFYLYDSYNNLTGIRIYNSGSSSATNYYVTTNVQGDVLGIYNANGDKLAGYEYDAWGNILSVTDANGNPITSETHIANINPFRYRGYYLDSETGLYYLNSRYYDAEVGRFISADTTDILSVQADLYDKNLFAYCDNNPVGRIDVGGDAWETVFDIASLCISMAEVAVNPADAWAWVGLAFDTLDLIPFVTGLGETAKALRLSQKGLEAAGDAGKSINRIQNTINYMPVNDLVPTHQLTRSKGKMNELVLNIKSNGIKEPINFVNYKGVNYIVDGHHRVAAAKTLGINEVPTLQVGLPFKGYKNIQDLFWWD